jgi:hypothetical protein
LILDTNALSAAAEEHPGVTRVLAGAQQLALPVVVIGEYRFGIAQSAIRLGIGGGWMVSWLTAECSTSTNRVPIIMQLSA